MTPIASWCFDFAYAEQGCLFLFGWLVEPPGGLRGLLLALPGGARDLGPCLIRTARSDVPAPPGRPDAGPGLLIAAAIGPTLHDTATLTLLAVLVDGSVQPITVTPETDPARLAPFARANRLALRHLLTRQPEAHAAQLSAILGRAALPASTMLPAPEPWAVSLLAQPLPDTLLVLGWCQSGTSPPPIRADDRTVPARLYPLAEQPGGFLLRGDLPAGPTPRQIRLGTGRDRNRLLAIRADEVPQGVASLPALLAGLGEQDQLSVLIALAHRITPASPETAAWQRLWAEAVASLPPHLDHPALGLRLFLDRAEGLGQAGLLLRGWLHAPTEPPPEVELLTGFGPALPLSTTWTRTARPDVWQALAAEGAWRDTDALGFTVFVPVVPPDPAGLVLQLTLPGVSPVRMRVALSEPMPADPVQAVRTVLAELAPSHRQLRPLLDAQLGPAVTALWSARPRPTAAPTIVQCGPAPADPVETSLIIPVYGRADLITFQLAEFANDPALAAQDLIYVIDDPALYDPIRIAAPDLAACYRVPFRLVYAGRNAGYAEATNLGASLARGRFVLLLNSDVLPCAPGWLGALIAAHRRHGAGAVGPRLLYPDGSVQHDGMRFLRHAGWDGLWVNDHPGKGLPPLPDTTTRPVPALTGACLLLATRDFHALGGLSDGYILGDFEDSDLCLRLRAAGRLPYLVPSVTLFHLERQSQNRIGPRPWRTALTLYNCWRHHRL